MKKSIFFLITLISPLFFSACNRNPISEVQPDAFAKAVNAFEDKDIGNGGIINCGFYYINPTGYCNSTPCFGLSMVDSCQKSIAKLAIYINQTNQFPHVSENDLEQKDTWEIYFKSQCARGK